ncbi:AcrR family transcriptional regulator [Inquilinus ginsengisoli]|uniref:AcrR family transcriptional regulator n=1 Tax=Inquilinus ginsengisoli TaxID=363840 RepID=A0ABU1JXS6_9PROT|nr:helix-turn-helix domain-containing protein [Inquilinus ginsengisoli]MDR6293413.1 AcrR family transcriptional regulator [Inquilinus ginsengisoli]
MAERGRPRGFDRDAALRRAMELFWRRGFEGVSMADLTAAMGIAAPSLYAAFGSKEALFREAIALYRATDGAATRRALDCQRTARAAIEAMLRDNADAFTDPALPNGCFVILGAINTAPEHEGVRAHLLDLHQESCGLLLRRLEQGATAGEFPPGTALGPLAGFYSTVLAGMSIKARDGTSRAEMHAIIDHAMAAWDAMTAATPAAAASAG